MGIRARLGGASHDGSKKPSYGFSITFSGKHLDPLGGGFGEIGLARRT